MQTTVNPTEESELIVNDTTFLSLTREVFLYKNSFRQKNIKEESPCTKKCNKLTSVYLFCHKIQK